LKNLGKKAAFSGSATRASSSRMALADEVLTGSESGGDTTWKASKSVRRAVGDEVSERVLWRRAALVLPGHTRPPLIPGERWQGGVGPLTGRGGESSHGRMTVKIKNPSNTEELSFERVQSWLREAGCEIPRHLDRSCIEKFLHHREKTYELSQHLEFLADIDGFHYALKGIQISLDNLEGYERHLSAQLVNDTLIRHVLGVSKTEKPSQELLTELGFVKEQILSELKDEGQYITECRESLKAQEQWHLEGSVDKGRIPLEVVKNAFAEALKKPAKAKDYAKVAYYEPIRNKLMSMGFVVSPPGTALGAVFPEKEWVRGLSDSEFKSKAKRLTDELMVRYCLLGDDSISLTRLLMTSEEVTSDQRQKIEKLENDEAQARVRDEELARKKREEMIQQGKSEEQIKLWEERTAKKKKTPAKTAKSEQKNLELAVGGLVSAVGCLCVSWTRHEFTGKSVYVPIVGLSGVVQEAPGESYFQKYCRHLGLPSWKPDPKVPLAPEYRKSRSLRRKLHALNKEKLEALGDTDVDELATAKKEKGYVLSSDLAEKSEKYDKIQELIKTAQEKKQKAYAAFKTRREGANESMVNYETMLHRTNLVVLGYRTRSRLKLRKPARQALFSYVSFREKTLSKEFSVDRLHPASQGVDLWVCGWHSLNCAEPAALMTASSYFGEGCDVLVCFPYEGFNVAGTFRNRPKETCAWCAAVELGFRSLSSNPGTNAEKGKNEEKVNDSVRTGTWLTQLTLTSQSEPKTALPVNKEFDAFDDGNLIMRQTREVLAGDGSAGLVRNSDLVTEAYSTVVETKIGRLRSMYHLLGLLDPDVVALDRPMYAHAETDTVTNFMSPPRSPLSRRSSVSEGTTSVKLQ